MRVNSISKWVLIGTICVAVTACGPTFRNHGYIPPQEDIDLIAIGVDTKASVEESVGSPTSGGVLSDGGFYYVRSRVRTFGPRAPKEINREVLAISFDATGVVSNIERFGLENGRVVVLERRVTDTAVQNKGFLRQLLGNIGRIGPSL